MRKKKYATGNQKLTDLESYYLQGPVKQVMETCYEAYLKDGKVMQGKIEIDSPGSETNYISTYNTEGMLLAEQLVGTSIGYLSTYNGKGLVLEKQTFYNNALYDITVHTYNEKNLLTHVVSTKANGDLSHKTLYTYNDIGQILESNGYYGKEEKLRRRTVNVYEDKLMEINGMPWRNRLSSINYEDEGKIESVHTDIYNEEGKHTESKTVYTDEKKHEYNRHTTYKYNRYGDCIEYTYYNTDGSIKSSSICTYDYDEQGKRIIAPREPYDPDALKPGETEELEYDHHKNWIKKTGFFEGRPVNIWLRQYSYYGEESENQPEFIHPATLVEPGQKVDVSRDVVALEPEKAKWLAEGMVNHENFPLHRYYAMKFNEIPSVINYNNSYTEAIALFKLAQEKMHATVIHSTGSSWSGYRERITRYTLNFSLHPGYVLQAISLTENDRDEYVVPTYIEKLLDPGDHLYFSSFVLLRPADSSPNRDEYFEDSLLNCISDCSLRRKPEKPYINIIEATVNGFVMKEHPVDDDFEIRDLNVNYGYGFEQFHNDLMQRFAKSTKGLVLFHGEPGTGKTYYIRHLLRKMVASRKVVIYMPPNMVDHLVEPGFMTFLTREVHDFSADGNFCVLLIEDAEPLLAKRQEGVRIQGVTNLLNLSDGLLNDMLNLQIICTFNVDLKKLDSALLRPGRLIARKEFKALSELDANLLAQRLGIKHHFTKPATLSEVYAMRKNQNTLIHDVEPDKDASTILDDL